MTFGSTFGRTFSPTFKPHSQAIASAGAWSPTDITGLQLWHDFSDANTLFTDAGSTKVTADNDAIYQANDKSGNNRHATQSTKAYRPLYKTNIQNGLSAAYFDGSNDVMTLVDLTLTNYTTFLVFRFLTPILTTAAIHAWDNYNASPRHGQILYQYRNVAPAGMYHEAYANSTGAIVDSGALINQTPYLVDFVRNGTALSVNKNATALTGITVGSGEFAMVGHRLGTHYYSGANQNQYGKAYACELLIYNSALSEGDQTTVRTYLNNKWAIY